MPYDTCEFKIKPLSYDYSDLEPYIDSETIHLHHNKHLQTYVDNLNKALQLCPKYQSWSLSQLVTAYNLNSQKIITWSIK